MPTSNNKDMNTEETEKLLQRATSLRLTPTEHASMKEVLLAHAANTLTHETRPSWFAQGWFKAAVPLAILCVVTGTTAYVSTESLPGERLYALKVDVIEEMIEHTKIQTDDRVAYEIDRLEIRLAEIKTLKIQGDIDMDALNEMSEQMSEHTETVTRAMHEDDTSFSPKERVEALSELVNVTEAQKTVMDDTASLTTLFDQVDDLNEGAEILLTDSIHTLVQESPADAENYLSEKLQDISEDVTDTELGEVNRTSVKQHVNDVKTALTRGDTEMAIESALKAERTIAVDEYLDSEAPEGI